MRSPITLLKDTFKSLFQDLRTFLIILAIPFLLTFVSSYVEDYDNAALVSVVLVIASIIATILMSIALTYYIADRSLSVLVAYKKAQKSFFKYLIYSLALSIVLLVGFVLFIIPGIYLAVVFAFGALFLLLEDRSVGESFSASKALVKGRWWPVAVRCLLMMLLGILVYALVVFMSGPFVLLDAQLGYAFSAAIGLIVTPISLIFTYELFQDLKNTQTVQEPVAQAQTQPEAAM